MRVGTGNVSAQGEGLPQPSGGFVTIDAAADYVARIIPIDEFEPDVVAEEPVAVEKVQTADDASQYDDEW